MVYKFTIPKVLLLMFAQNHNLFSNVYAVCNLCTYLILIGSISEQHAYKLHANAQSHAFAMPAIVISLLF